MLADKFQFVEQTDFAHLFVGLTYVYTPFRRFLLSKPTKEAWYVINAQSALDGIAALPRMASAEGCIPRRLDFIQLFELIPSRLTTDSIRSQASDYIHGCAVIGV